MVEIAIVAPESNLSALISNICVSFDPSWLRARDRGDRTRLSAICAEVAERHYVTVEDIRGLKRHRYIAWPRQEFMFIAYSTGRWSTTTIGRWCGSRDHTTVIHSCKAHARRNGLKVPKRGNWSCGVRKVP